MAKESFYRNKNILITGGLGFIGSNLAIKLIALGSKVTLLDALVRDYGANKFNIFPVKDQVKIKIGDMRNLKLMEQMVKEKDIIFNLAGTLSHVDSMTDPFSDLDINCKAQLSLLEACKKNNLKVKVVYAGTRNQYGKAIYLPVDEKHIQEPTDINGINSIAAEKYHLLYNKIYKIQVTSLRMTNTYGPRHQMKHPRQGVLNWFIRQLLDGETVHLFGDGSQIRDINYVDDVIEALLRVAKKKNTNGQVYNLGGQPLTLREFVELAIRLFGRGKYKFVKFPTDRKDIEIGNYVADIKKIRDEVGWEPTTSPKQGISDTIEYFLKYKKYYW